MYYTKNIGSILNIFLKEKLEKDLQTIKDTKSNEASENEEKLKQQLIDELAIFICPSLLIDRDAIEVFYDTTFQSIENKVNLKLIDTVQFENDLLLKYKLCY